jgi:hypothetical protein
MPCHALTKWQFRQCTKPIAAFKLAFRPVLVARVVVQSIASVR